MICVPNVITELISGLTNHQVTSKRQADHSSRTTQSTYHVLSHCDNSIYSTASLHTTVLQIESGVKGKVPFSWTIKPNVPTLHMSCMYCMNVNRDRKSLKRFGNSDRKYVSYQHRLENRLYQMLEVLWLLKTGYNNGTKHLIVSGTDGSRCKYTN